jgi:hypothetical protein
MILKLRFSDQSLKSDFLLMLKGYQFGSPNLLFLDSMKLINFTQHVWGDSLLRVLTMEANNSLHYAESSLLNESLTGNNKVNMMISQLLWFIIIRNECPQSTPRANLHL